jgi:DNA-binding MarR family transcriptional regulator
MQQQVAPRHSSRSASADEAALRSDVAAFSEAIQDLLRLYQFRDRERICCYDITVSECYALEALLRGGPQTLNEVARALRLDKSTASRVIRSVEEKGYVLRGAHPEDGRALVLEISTRGRALVDRIQADLEARYRSLLEGVDAESRRAVLTVIRRLHAEAACGPACGEPAI